MTDDISVVYISPIVLAVHVSLHEVVERIEIDIAEKLAGEVADGESAAGWREEKTLRVRQALPVGKSAKAEAINRGIDPDDGRGEIGDKINVNELPPRERAARHGTAVRHAVNRLKCESLKTGARYAHEIAADVDFKDIGRPCVRMTDRGYVVAEPLDPVVCAALTDAAIRIRDESSLKKAMGIVKKKVVYNPVPEIGSKDLAEFGIGDDEASGWAGRVATLKKFGRKATKIVIEIGLKRHLIGA